MKRLLPFILLFLLKQNLFCQDLRIYHGEKSESVYLKQNDVRSNTSRESLKIVRGIDGVVTIHILNPNPFFYNYEIKTEDVDIVDDYSDQFADLVKLITGLPDIAEHFKTAGARFGPPADGFDKYRDALGILDGEIKAVRKAIKESDRPETKAEAIEGLTNAGGRGFRAAIDEIEEKSSESGHFRSASLEKDLNDLLDKAIADGSFDSKLGLGGNTTLLELFKQAFQHLNISLSTISKDIINITKKDRVLRFQIPVKENKRTSVRLIITKIKEDAVITRELLNEEIATILPLYVRKRFEVVPVVNLVFQSNQQKFSIVDGLVKSNPDDDAKFNIGAMALINFASFGPFKEYGVGFGVGYSLQTKGGTGSFFAIPSLSYKSIFRVGFGFGYNLTAIGLKDGATVGAPLPEKVTDIDDVIEYKRRPAAVFTLAISGLKL